MKESLFTYLTTSGRMSQLINSQEILMNKLFSQIESLHELFDLNFLSLEVGFENLKLLLDSTEERVTSWSGNDRVLPLAGLLGFILGTLAVGTRYIILGAIVCPHANGRNSWNFPGISFSGALIHWTCLTSCCLHCGCFRRDSCE
jgi:hypothetical protein